MKRSFNIVEHHSACYSAHVRSFNDNYDENEDKKLVFQLYTHYCTGRYPCRLSSSIEESVTEVVCV